jgi:periplasmic divalent cation tolerance protein
MEADVLLLLITCADHDEASRIGTALVAERLAACVHIRAHEAIYRWEGRIEHQPEYTLLAKTVRGRYAALEARVVAMHSYALPCIVAVAVEAGSAAFLAWVVGETGSAPQ